MFRMLFLDRGDRCFHQLSLVPRHQTKFYMPLSPENQAVCRSDAGAQRRRHCGAIHAKFYMPLWRDVLQAFHLDVFRGVLLNRPRSKWQDHAVVFFGFTHW
eukprot:gnl/TRDRNA2_/TRDRNA2_182020_c0_seq1.p1 gnl/TRDRNA2_/TRDRNA2_182020_c0~~gnl/TRDRNA2_/TRDRNA2_182020_c0_seq1.p1  ORF type:complete len:101 (-),score=8.47 gnl/TRDRNA2_/TRDRNA2_182020_c0_seq1:379-681(-)